MATTSQPKFPVIIQIVPQPRWQRSLIPMDELPAIENSGDEPGWIADSCYQIIDSEREIFTASYDDGRYSFHRSAMQISDDDLRELMYANLRSVRQSSTEYAENAAALVGNELFAFTYNWIQRTPDMSWQMRSLGCTAIIVLCSLAATIPIIVVWWFFLR